VGVGRERAALSADGGGRGRPAGGRSVGAGEILTLGTGAIHRIANPRSDDLIALHVYGRNVLKVDRSAWDPVTMRERPYVARTDNVVSE